MNWLFIELCGGFLPGITAIGRIFPASAHKPHSRDIPGIIHQGDQWHRRQRTTVYHPPSAQDAPERIHIQQTLTQSREGDLWFCRIKATSGNVLFFSCNVAAHVSDPKRLPTPALSRDIIAQCVRWYLACLCNLEEMMAERGIFAGRTILSVDCLKNRQCRFRHLVSVNATEPFKLVVMFNYGKLSMVF